MLDLTRIFALQLSVALASVTTSMALHMQSFFDMWKFAFSIGL